jgi:dipeptidyl aminopeptidase/acylaminoacyl peptidase
MKIALAVAALLVLAAACGLLALAWRASSSAMEPGIEPLPWTLADFPSLRAEEVSIDGSTGARLSGRLFRGRERATVVLTHGYGGTQDELLPVAATLHDAGLTVFTYDSRGCGASTGEITFGAREQDDLVAVVDRLARRDDVDPERIGAFGFSMGGAATILAAAKEPRIRAVAADSAWTTAKSWLRPSLGDMFTHPRQRFTTLSVAVLERRLGIDLDELRPVDAMGELQGRPVLLIHGDADHVVLPQDSEALAEAGGREVELWRVAGAGHGATIARGGAATTPRLAAFFERALS